MAEPPTLSYSSVRTYQECPLRWKFLYVDRLPEAPRGYFSFGRTVHAVLEELARPLVVPVERALPGGRTQRTLEQFTGAGTGAPPRAPMSREELLAAYARLWVSEGYASPEEESRYRAQGEEMLLHYYAEFTAEPPTPVAVEAHLEARWEGLPIHGYLDRIDLTAEGGLEILDYKTTRNLSWADAAGSDQLSFYQVLVEQNYRAPVAGLVLYDLRGHGALRVKPRAAAELDALHTGVGEVSDGIRDERFDPRPARHCQRCEFQSRCPEFRSVPSAERERLRGLVDRFVALRDQEARVDAELRRVADELHQEAERLALHRIPGTAATALRRREERRTLGPEAEAALREDPVLLARVSQPDPAAVERLIRGGPIDPARKRRLQGSLTRSVRWFWELDTEGESPRAGKG